MGKNNGKAVSEKGIVSKHKSSLAKLQSRDPEFYEFLKNEDQKLLNFNDSGSEIEEDDISDTDDIDDPKTDDILPVTGSMSDDSSEDEGVHQFPTELQVASDSGEDDDDSGGEQQKEPKSQKKGKQTRVTIAMVNQWCDSLQVNNSIQAVKQVVLSFKAVIRTGTSSDSEEPSVYKVEGTNVFNSIVRLCITDLIPAIHRILNLPKSKISGKSPAPSSSPKWKKVKIELKSYLTDVIRFVSDLGNSSVMNIFLKHISHLIEFYACFPKLVRLLLKKMILVWSTGDETSRVLSFLNISRLVRTNQQNMLEMCIKQMYMAYVKNCKFTSPTTLPLINFMQRSIVEIFVLDMELTYQYAFVYIRQLAIHLRNAITVKKPETCQAVYNWQYIHSLHLWTRLVSQTHPNPSLQPLIYPLTQTLIGTIKLMPIEKYYPLRFQCVKALNTLSGSTDTFIPVLPFLTEILETTDFNKKHKNISFKPINFACILKLSKAQLQEKAFRDGVIDQLYDLFLENLHIHAHTIGFPELALPTIMAIKPFLKKCKIANYTKQIKQILERSEENSKVIMQRRKTVSLSLNNKVAVSAWEVRSKEEGTPLTKYYSTWRKLRDRELQLEISGKEQISTDNLPSIERPQKRKKTATDEERKEFADLFDNSDDEDDNIRFLLKEERPKKVKRAEDSGSEYSDFDEKDLETLAGSGEDDEASEGPEESDEASESEESPEDGNAEDDDDSDDDLSGEEDIVQDLTFSSDEE